MVSGLNEYLPANTIDDALMSDEIDVYPYREECVLFNANTSIQGFNVSVTKDEGHVRACINSDESTTDTEVFYLMTSNTTEWYIIKHVYTISTDTTSFNGETMTMTSVPSDPDLVDSSSAIFKVEADTYYVFSNTHEKRIHFIKHTSTGDSYSYVDVPSYPKKLVAHASRIFFIDTENKIWWCRAGDLYSWYSMEYDADALVTTRNCANASFTVAAQPSTTRQVTATVTKVGNLDTLGILTIVGTNGLDEAQTAVLTLAEGRVQSSMAFKTITTITQSGWTTAGTADTIVVGVAPVGLGFVTDDAGYWTLEQELFLHDVCILGNAMYIFTNHNIYIFQGYSPDTFSLSKIIADIGIDRMETPNGYHKLSTGRNMAFFIYDGFVYEFNGNDQPRIISRPVVINNQSSNGIMGGISFSGESWVLQAIADALCVYDYTGDTDYFYFYAFETKTWWKRSGVNIGDIGQITAEVPAYLDWQEVTLYEESGLTSIIYHLTIDPDYPSVNKHLKWTYLGETILEMDTVDDVVTFTPSPFDANPTFAFTLPSTGYKQLTFSYRKGNAMAHYLWVYLENDPLITDYIDFTSIYVPDSLELVLWLEVTVPAVPAYTVLPYYTGSETLEKILYVPSFNRQKWFNFISITSDTQDYVYSNTQGCTQGTETPFFVTKAFNSNPSETGSLTELILAIKGTDASTANIKVQYSLTVDGDDFVDIKTYDGYIFNGDLEVLSIPVPISYIANAHHYRLRVEIGNCSDTEGVYLYNIERRFRVKGRSR
jgi:hypothetical protein